MDSNSRVNRSMLGYITGLSKPWMLFYKIWVALSFLMMLVAISRCQNQTKAKVSFLFWFHRGGSRIFFRRGCTRLLLYFNTNKPHSSFFFCRIPVVLENRRSSQGGVRTPCTLPLDPPLFNGLQRKMYSLHVFKYTYSSKVKAKST